VHPQLRRLYFLMRNRQVIALQFCQPDTPLRAERSRNVSAAVVVVGIVFMEHIEEFGFRKVDALDGASRALTATWSIAETGKNPTSMAFDEDAIACF